MDLLENEVIELTHTAKNRVELAKGAVKAALWLLQHPGIYDFKEIALKVENWKLKVELYLHHYPGLRPPLLIEGEFKFELWILSFTP